MLRVVPERASMLSSRRGRAEDGAFPSARHVNTPKGVTKYFLKLLPAPWLGVHIMAPLKYARRLLLGSALLL